MTRYPSRSRHVRMQSLLIDLVHLAVIAACAVWTAKLIVRERGFIAVQTPANGGMVRIARSDAGIVRIRLDEAVR